DAARPPPPRAAAAIDPHRARHLPRAGPGHPRLSGQGPGGAAADRGRAVRAARGLPDPGPVDRRARRKMVDRPSPRAGPRPPALRRAAVAGGEAARAAGEAPDAEAAPVKRWAWVGDDPLSIASHDDEWGVPVHDDRVLYEFLVLEGAQAGLSWMTILRKREGYRRAFDGFAPRRVARYDARKVARLL